MKKYLIFILCSLLLFVLGKFVYQEYQEHKDDKRILVMISSYKRPLLLSGQLIRFANQTYKKFDISVSVKGAPEEYVRQTFMQEWIPLIKKGKLFVRFDENKDQLANLLDTVRDVKLEDYDYFCKVDDDDWYAPTYLEEVNRWLKKGDNIAISNTTNAFILKNGETSVQMHVNNTDLSGPTMCFSKALINLALELDRDPSALEPHYSSSYIIRSKARREDRLLYELAPLVGEVQQRSTNHTQVIYGQQYPSVIRNWGYLLKEK